jgi:dolichyl-phosphate-mannose-protein mannosyltransferase
MSNPESEKELSRLDLVSADGIKVETASTTTQLNDERAGLGETGAANDNCKHTTVFTGVRKCLAHRWAECVLAVIVISAASLSLYWVFKVPLLQCPDEDLHVDYAFSIYSAGRLLNVRTTPSAWNTHPKAIGNDWELISHRFTLYLIEATNSLSVMSRGHQMAPDYGTTTYYQTLDRNAPQSPPDVPDLGPRDNPWMVTSYPFAYYGAVAMWISLFRAFSDSLTGMFFWARAFSVVLLMCSLVLVYVLARELRFARWFSLLLTAIIGFFPLTSYVSSCVQADNLSFPLVLLCFYSVLRVRRAPGSAGRLAILGTALGVLLVTKYHVYLCVLAAVSALLISEYLFQRRPGKVWLQLFVFLALPSFALGLVQLWVGWGARESFGSNLHPTQLGAADAFSGTFMDYYVGGYSLRTFWNLPYGWASLPRVVGVVIIGLTLLTLILMFVRSEKVLTRLVQLAGRGRWRWALRLAFSNPLLISHFVFTIFMIFLYALSDNSFVAQGRHWFPYILSSFLIATKYAPQAFTHRRTQAAFSLLMVLGLALYCAFGSYHSIQAIKERYYVARPSPTESGG